MIRIGTSWLLAGTIVLCLALALGGQAMAEGLVSDTSGTDINRSVGRAASSYLTGIRVYAAAALWNRIDPLSHNYYGGVGLDDQLYMLSTIAAVQALDPHAVQSYYVGAWILVRNDRVADGLEMARRGADENPTSGIALTGCAQLLYLYGEDLEEAADVAERALGPGVQWADSTEQHDAYAVLRDIFKAAGREDLYAFLVAEIKYLGSLPVDAPPSPAHDHDGDGVPDH